MPYLIPYLTTTKPPATPSLPTLRQHWLFLERNGTHLMEIPEEALAAEGDPIRIATNFLTENDLAPAGTPFQVGDYVFAPVDKTSKDLAAFYSWAETPLSATPVRESWRSFLWLSNDSQADPWGVNKLLEDISLGPSPHTAFQVIQAMEAHLKAGHDTSIEDGNVNPQ